MKMRNYPEEKMETGGNRPQHRKISQGFKASGECLSNIVKMQEQLIFLLAALTAGISCLTALISSLTVADGRTTMD